MSYQVGTGVASSMGVVCMWGWVVGGCVCVGGWGECVCGGEGE